MIEFEVVTSFYTIIPWLTGGFIIAGIVLSVASALLLGWWIGAKSTPKKSYKLWFGLGWIPIFAIFFAGTFSGTTIYYEARNDLADQIKEVSGLTVATFVHGNDQSFIGRKEDGTTLVTCGITDLKQGETYRVRCR